ncbi:MAG: hypothetical protein V1859_09400 [archaeon]
MNRFGNLEKPYYKEVLKCRICAKRYFVEKGCKLYEQKQMSKSFCLPCYTNYMEKKKNSQIE